MEIRHYVTTTGRDPYQGWLDRLKDLRARVAIHRRVDRISMDGSSAETGMKTSVARVRQGKVKAMEKVAPYRAHEGATIESFRKAPRFAAKYLNAVLADGDQEELMVALRYMAEAFGGVPTLAARAQLNATTLYRTLSPKGNPELKSLTALLNAMGMRLAVQPVGEDGR